MLRRCGSRALGRPSARTATVGRGRRPADGSWWSVLLGNAPEPRPLPLFGRTFSGGGLLVGSDEGGIEHQVLVLRVIDESREHPLPDARLRPAREARVDALPFAVSLGQLVPLRSRS